MTRWDRHAWRVLLLLGASVAASIAAAQPASAPAPRDLIVHAQRIVDVRAGKTLDGAAIHVRDKRIVAVGPRAEVARQAPPDAEVLDLGDVTILPGLIDSHTHLMARVPEGPGGHGLNLLTKSEAYRALEGAANARATLRAGFTTVRDVGNEGSRHADVALRDAIERGLVEGPRMRIATRAIASTGQYFPFGVAPDLETFPRGAQMVSGVEEARRAAREQIGHGADLIKVDER
jgi:imidazolonepropionase-like amidohydrolase